MTTRGGPPPGEARTRIPYTNPPLVILLDGRKVITGRGATLDAPRTAPADEVLNRIAAWIGTEGMVLIAPGPESWEYLTKDASAWKITGGPAWFTAARNGQRLRLCLLGYVDGANDPLIGPDNLTTVVRHQRFALLTGVQFYADGGATGAVLMDATMNVKGAPPLRAWREGPRPQEAPWLGPWGRPEYSPGVKLDKNAYYLGSANSALLPLDALTYMEGEPADDRVGLYHLRVPGNPESRLPHPLGANARIGAWQWVAQPTVDLLTELGAIVEIDGSWTCPRERSRRALVPWYERLRDARTAAMMGDDDDAHAIRQAVKDTYSRGIGCLDRESRRWFRPDWRAIMYAQARTCMYRVLLRAGREAGRWPAETRTDSVVYEGADVPPTFRVGGNLGQWKVTTL